MTYTPPKDGIYAEPTPYEIMFSRIKALAEMEGEPVGKVIRQLNQITALAEKALIEPEAGHAASEIDEDWEKALDQYYSPENAERD